MKYTQAIEVVTRAARNYAVGCSVQQSQEIKEAIQTLKIPLPEQAAPITPEKVGKVIRATVAGELTRQKKNGVLAAKPVVLSASRKADNSYKGFRRR